MPPPAEAGRALEVAVRVNTLGAEHLLAILLTAPAAVKRKPADRLGPLGMMVRAGGTDHGPTIEAGLARPTLPSLHLAGAEILRQEWLAGRLTLAELADAVERCLLSLGRGPYRHWAQDGWQELKPGA